MAYVIYAYHIAMEKQPSRSNKLSTNMYIGMLLWQLLKLREIKKKVNYFTNISKPGINGVSIVIGVYVYI